MKKNESPAPYRGPLKAVIFDWAGTVVDYGSIAPVAAFVEVLKNNDVEITMAEAREPMGRAKRDHIAAILQMPAVRERWKSAHGAVPEERDIDRLYEQFLPTQLECLKDYGELIPGAAEAVSACRQRGLKIGSSTGYTRELMEVVLAEARRQGFEPDCVLCADDISAGRPAPWLIFENARRLDVYPISAIVKVDDTCVGIEAGRNAGAWTVGIAKSGNLMGLNLTQAQQLEPNELQQRLSAAEAKLFAAGADYVIDSVADLLPVLDDIESRLSAEPTDA